MICPPADMQVVIFVQQCHKNHKVWVESLNGCATNANELFANMDFSILIDFDGTKISSSSSSFLPFDKDIFLPLHLCRLRNDSPDFRTSGYR